MAEEPTMTPVVNEPPKMNPLAGLAPKAQTVAAATPVKKPAGTVGLKAGLRLPTQTTLKAGLKLPTQNTLKAGLKLPTQNAVRAGLKLPTKPVIRKPNATVTAAPLPKPVAAAIPAPEVEKPVETLKAVTQKLKGITQEIPQQAILRKTGIIAEDATTAAQKEAAKHKTARISLSDAIGVAPVKSENAPMKTIRIRRPIDIPNPTASLKPLKPEAASPVAETAMPAKADDAAVSPSEAETKTKAAVVTESPTKTTASTITQRKTLKIARPSGGMVRPSGKFGVKRPTQPSAAAPAEKANAEGGAPADIADIPDMPMANVPAAADKKAVDEGPTWLWTLSALIQAAACVAVASLAWMLFQNTQVAYF